MTDNDPGLTAYQDMSSRALVEDMNRIQAQMVQVELPRWKCHKEVHALKIEAVKDTTEPGDETDGSRVLIFSEKPFAPLRVNREYVAKHKPEAGGYYVVYEDGYTSFSPAKAFEDGYARI